MKNENFPNIHEVLQEASTESKKESEQLVTQTFKITPESKDIVKKICESNGTTPSKFYQKCTERLVADYLS